MQQQPSWQEQRKQRGPQQRLPRPVPGRAQHGGPGQGSPARDPGHDDLDSLKPICALCQSPRRFSSSQLSI